MIKQTESPGLRLCSMFYWLSTLNQGLQGATLENQIPELASYDQAKQAQFQSSWLCSWPRSSENRSSSRGINAPTVLEVWWPGGHRVQVVQQNSQEQILLELNIHIVLEQFVHVFTDIHRHKYTLKATHALHICVIVIRLWHTPSFTPASFPQACPHNASKYLGLLVICSEHDAPRTAGRHSF